ncbi:BQ2448_4508 [Microbotryum intermedium]|uniref:BQ2448_4508 protein n=1 Tax=Microbotryum intermedium TaxID=269621 RepID=A0A238FIV9_9BASI|nr:BQ2448_4508 [Microbotryum intermedium]
MVDQFFNKARPFTKRQREPSHGDASASSSSSDRRGAGSSGGRFGSRPSSGARGAGTGRKHDGGGSGSAFHNKNPRRDQPGNVGAKGKGNASGISSSSRQQDDDDLNDDKFDSDDQDDDEEDDEDEFEEEQDDPLETPAQKRLRLSQMYLDSLAKEAEGQDDIGFDAADLDRDIIAERLQQDVLQHSGKLHLFVANKLVFPIDPSKLHQTPRKAHRGPLTSAVASQDARWLYTASKDGSIIKWDLSKVAQGASAAVMMDDGENASETRGRINKAVYLPKRKRDPAQIANKEESAKARGKKKALTNNAQSVGHATEVLSLDLSMDGTMLASGGADRVIGVWDVKGEGAKWIRGLSGHKDRVASLAFRQGTQELYSSSFDRTIKLYDLSTLSYVETLFGHQDSIQHIAALRGELAVSAGGRDKTVRYWKVAEESQLVFRGGVASRVRNVLDGAFEEEDVAQVEGERKKRKERGEVKYVEGSIECVAMVDDTTFLSGGDSGSICLWTTTKKKPIASRQLAHGTQDTHSATEGIIATPRWITALGCLPYGDLFASGSWDGLIRLWRIDEKMRSFEVIGEIPAVGYVNSLQIVLPNLGQVDKEGDEKSTEKSVMVVASTSKEPRLGRWNRLKEGREGAIVVEIPLRRGI